MLQLLLTAIIAVGVFRVLSKVKFKNGLGGKEDVTVQVRLKTSQTQEFQLFFDGGGGFTPKQSVSRLVQSDPEVQQVTFNIRSNRNLSRLRLDAGKSTDTVYVESMTVSNGIDTFRYRPDELNKIFGIAHECTYGVRGDRFWLLASGNDPYIITTADLSAVFDKLYNRSRSPFMAAVFALITAVFLLLCMLDYSPPAEDGLKNRLPGPDAVLPDQERKGRFRVFSSWLLITCFCALLLLPYVLKITHVGEDADAAENRFKAPFPVIGFETAAAFPDDYSSWFNDHFGGRSWWIRLYSKLMSDLFSLSAMPDRVMIGKDGWLFYANENTPEYYRNESLFTAEQLEKIRGILEERAQWCRLHQARYYLLLAPMASSIYPEFLPDFIRKDSSVSGLDQVVEYLKKTHARVTVVDLRKDFRLEKKKRMIYYKTDFHWNLTGAFLAYRKLAETINRDTFLCKVPGEEEFVSSVVTTFDADLAGLLNLQQEYSRDQVVLRPIHPRKARMAGKTLYPGQELFKQDPVVYVNDSSGLPPMVMFRDSYANYLIPFLAEHFGKSAFIWTNHFIPEIVTGDQPVVVIQQLVEKFIRDLLLENPPGMKRELQSYRLHGNPVTVAAVQTQRGN